MLEPSYLLMGLDGLSHAHGKDYFRDGHLAAAVIAAYYLCHENNLGEATQDLVKSRIDNELRDNVIFRPGPDEPADSTLLEQLLDTLSGGIGDLREVGHNIIFGAAALKAFRDCPAAITPSRVEGICGLIDDFATTQNVTLKGDEEIPGIEDEGVLIEFIFSEYLRAVSLYSGYGQGWAGHLLTIGHAVIELSRLGYPDLAAPAHKAYRMYIMTMRRGPKATDRPIPDKEPRSYSPLEREYWERKDSISSGIGHALKYPYSFYNLLNSLYNPDLKNRCLEKSYLIF